MSCIPVIPATSISVDDTTEEVTIDLLNTPVAGNFIIKLNPSICSLSKYPSYRLLLNSNGTAYDCYQRNGNYAMTGQYLRQIQRQGCLHCNLTSNPSGDVTMLDKPAKCCTYNFCCSNSNITPIIVDVIANKATGD